MLRIGVVGAGGRMGRTVCTAVLGADDMELVCAIDPAAAGQDLTELLEGPSPDLAVSGGIDALATAQVDVAVDFTTAAGIGTRLDWYAGHGVHAVVGTSGIPPSEVERARELFAGSSANAVIAPNFAGGRGAPDPLLRAGRAGDGRGRDRRAAPRGQARRAVGDRAAHRRADRPGP